MIFLSEPSPPTNFKVIAASSDQVILTWNEPLNKNGVITNYILKYISLTTNKKSKVDVDANKLKYVVKGLLMREAYLFKIVAVTSAGVSEESELSVDLSRGKHL